MTTRRTETAAMARRVSSDDEETKELLNILACFGPQIRRCVGGHLVAVGYVCLNCDSTCPTRKCNKEGIDKTK